VATQPVILKPDKTIEQIGYIVDLKVARATVVTQKDFEFERFKNQKDIFITGKMFGLSGTCLLIRKNEFISIRMLDESFHSYLEDIDLSMRLALSGYSYAPCLESSVIHEHMATSRKMGSYKEWHDLTNWIKIIIKNYPKWFIFVNLPSLCIERMRNISGFLKKKYAKNV
jgi:GT2 family glycosyltransferase